MNRIVFGAPFCALGLLLLAACGDSGAGDAKDTSAAFIAARDALAAKLIADGGKGKMPGPSDPTVKAFEARAGEAMATLGTPAMPVKAFDTYDQLCGKTAPIIFAYVTAGVDQAPEASRAELMGRNTEQYMDQLLPPVLFAAHCSAVHLASIDKAVSADDLRTKGAALGQIRQGAYAQANGLLQIVGDLDGERRRKVVDLLASDAGNFAIVFSREQRQELVALTDRLRAGLPEDARGQADRIKAGFQQAPCGQLCTM